MTLDEQKAFIIETAFQDELEKLAGLIASTPESPSMWMRVKALGSKTTRDSNKANKQLYQKFKEAGTRGFAGSFTDFRNATEESRNAFNTKKHQQAIDWANKSYRDPNFLDFIKKHKVGLGVIGIGAAGLMAYSAANSSNAPQEPELPKV